MEQTKLALSAVMIVAVGLIGTNFVTYSELIGQEEFNALSNSNPIYGHLTIVHSDPDGNILSYMQTDNVIGSIGLDCLSERIFGNHGTTCEAADVSVGFTNTNFTTIALFDGQTFRNTINATKDNDLLGVKITAAGLTIRNGGEGVIVTNTQAGDSGTAPSITSIVKTFTAGANVQGQDVDGAALFNNGTGVGGGEAPTAVLAAQTFTKVTLNEADTLKITWLISLG